MLNQLDRTFQALGDPTRRALVERLTDVPASVSELVGALKGVPAYAASFALLCLFWHAHYIWYRRYGLEDGRSVLLSLLLVFLVLIYVYPLRMMFSTAVAAWSGGILPAGIDNAQDQDMMPMFVIYGIAYAALSGIVALFYLHARSLREQLDLDPAERLVTHAQIARWVFNAVIGLLSATAALVIPFGAPVIAYAAPGMIYVLLVLGGPLLRRRLRKQLAALKPAT